MKRTLYVSGAGVRVHLDGPSLSVRKQGEADRRFPLCRLSRVVCSSAAGLPWDALQACGEAGLTVLALKADGTPRGIWMPWVAARTGIGELVEEWVESGRWKGGWSIWCAGRESREMATTAWKLKTRLPDLRPPLARRHLLEVGGIGVSTYRRWLLEGLRGLLYSHVGTRLLKCGFDPLLLAGRQPGFEPARRITEILHWRHIADVSRITVETGEPGDRLLLSSANIYESLAEREERRIREFIDAWAGWLGGQW